jgi:hypothetical protein
VFAVTSRHLVMAAWEALNVANDGRLTKLLGFDWVLLPIRLFSRGVEQLGRPLSNAVLVMEAILLQFEFAHEHLRRDDVYDDEIPLLYMVTANFVARLRTTTFSLLLTAFAFSCQGQYRIRLNEQSPQPRNFEPQAASPAWMADLFAEFEREAGLWDFNSGTAVAQ